MFWILLVMVVTVSWVHLMVFLIVSVARLPPGGVMRAPVSGWRLLAAVWWLVWTLWTLQLGAALVGGRGRGVSLVLGSRVVMDVLLLLLRG